MADSAPATPTGLGASLEPVLRLSSSAGVCVVDGERIIRWTNPTLERILGRPVGSLTGESLLKVATPDQCAELWRVADSGACPASVSCVATLRRGDGGEAHVRLWAEVLGDDEDRAGDVLVTIFDRSDRESRRKVREHSLHMFEELFGALTQNSPEGMVVVDEAGTVVFWNPAAERLFGWTRSQALGCKVHELIAPQRYHETILHGVAAFRDSGGGPAVNHTHELVARHRDGREIPVELTISTVRIEERWHAVANLRDISERKLAEKRLRDSAAQLKTLLDSLHTGVVAWDNDTGFIVAVNPEAARLLGAPRERLVGSCFDEALRTLGDAPECQRLCDTAGRNVECRIERLDGAEFAALMRATPAVLDDRPCTVVSFVDITARAAAEAEQRRAATAAERAARVKAEFLANMSHEIRTPLNAVLGFASLLAETTLDPTQEEYVTRLGVAGEALLEIVDTVLDFSRIESGRLELEAAPFDLHEMVGDVGQLLATRAEERGLDLTCFVEPTIPRHMVGDPTRLRQVLVNLVGNAVKFTEHGRVELRVTPAGGGNRRRALRFTVADTGIGIPADRLEAIFESFTQADGSTTRRYGGSGLGLTISRRLVQAMGGVLEAASEVGRGSTFSFTVSLPVAEILPSGLTAPRRDSLRGVRVLVVDDSPVNRTIVARTLTPLGCHCTEAGDGEEGLLLLRQAAREGRSFDLVVLDHHMPRVDGAQLARFIHGDPSLAGLRVLLLSSAAVHRHEAGLDGETCHSILTKPIRQTRLVDTVLSLLGRRLEPGTAPKTSATDEPPLAAADGRRLRVLLAEDNETNRLVARSFLERLGADTVIAVNGRDALERWRESEPDVVLMDVQMPELDGLEATRAIREAEAPSRRTPIIAMTAHVLPGDRERCVAAGMDDYLSKPIDPEALSNTLARWALGNDAKDRESSTPAPPPPSRGATAPFDRDVLLRITDGDAAFAEHLLEIYVREAGEQLATLRAAVASGAIATVRQVAHTLRGSSATVGAQTVVEAALALERAATADDPGDLRAPAEFLLCAFSEVEGAAQTPLAAAS